MTKQVALADATYARLKARKQAGESFSQVIERLMHAKKDPMAFVGHRHKPLYPAAARLRMIEEDRDTGWVDA
jgi:predicted CopG family antitoxin